MLLILAYVRVTNFQIPTESTFFKYCSRFSSVRNFYLFIFLFTYREATNALRGVFRIGWKLGQKLSCSLWKRYNRDGTIGLF